MKSKDKIAPLNAATILFALISIVAGITISNKYFLVSLLGLYPLSIMCLSYNHIKESLNKKKDYRSSILYLLAEVMKADKKNMVCELGCVKSTICRYYKTKEEQDAALKEFQSFLKDYDYPFNSVENREYEHFQSIEKLKFAAKSEIIMELLAVAYADDNFHAKEKFKIGYIISKIGISLQEYNSIKAIFLKKYKEGYYKSADEQKSEQSKSNENSNNKSHNYSNYHKTNSQSEYNNYKHSKESRTEDSNNTLTKEKEACTILGVDSNASDAEIKKAYRALAIKYHPDNVASLGEEAIRQATETMKQINIAWEVVKMERGIK